MKRTMVSLLALAMSITAQAQTPPAPAPEAPKAVSPAPPPAPTQAVAVTPVAPATAPATPGVTDPAEVTPAFCAAKGQKFVKGYTTKKTGHTVKPYCRRAPGTKPKT